MSYYQVRGRFAPRRLRGRPLTRATRGPGPAPHGAHSAVQRSCEAARCRAGPRGRSTAPTPPGAPALLACRQCSGRKGMQRPLPGPIRAAHITRAAPAVPAAAAAMGGTGAIARAWPLPCTSAAPILVSGVGAARRCGGRRPPARFAAPWPRPRRQTTRFPRRPGLAVALACRARPCVGWAGRRLGCGPPLSPVSPVSARAAPPGRPISRAAPAGGRWRRLAAHGAAPDGSAAANAPGAGVFRCGGVTHHSHGCKGSVIPLDSRARVCYYEWAGAT